MIRTLIFSFSLVFILSSLGQAQKVQALVSKCYDLTYSGLGEKAKDVLIDAIYDPTYAKDEAYIRFALGQICMDLKEVEGAKYQWNIVYSKYPEGEQAAQIKIFFKVLNWAFEGWVSDSKFSKEYELSSFFWNKKDPDPRMNATDLIDPIMALRYLQELYERYPDEDKRATILYDQFLLFMGYNANEFGYKQISESHGNFDNDPSLKYYKEIKTAKADTSDLIPEPDINMLRRGIYSEDDQSENYEYDFKPIRRSAKSFFLSQAIAISESLRSLVVGNPLYVRTQFLIGVSLSGSMPYSSKLKVTPESKPFFENVVAATEGEETNFYRLFAMKWLSEPDLK